MKRDDIARFLDTPAVGSKSRYSYVTPLRAFRAWALEHKTRGESPSVDTVRRWLKRDAAKSPLANVVQRMGVISRYLDWRASGGADSERSRATRAAKAKSYSSSGPRIDQRI
jgi:hypothetical protein